VACILSLSGPAGRRSGTRPAASADIASVRKLYTTKVAWSKLKIKRSQSSVGVL
jgi:hypothetical protein